MIKSPDSITLSERAVQGLLRGLAAGAGMAAFLAVAGIFAGDSLAQIFSRFTPGGQGSPLEGILLHLGVSGVYGMLFALLDRLRPRWLPAWLAGMLYGAALFALAEWVILPHSSSGLGQFPLISFGIAHLVYGLALGFKPLVHNQVDLRSLPANRLDKA